MSEQHNQWVIEATDDNFEQEVVQRSKEIPVVVDFWAEWCAPCRALGPVLEKLTEEYAGKFILAKVNTEQAHRAASDFGVQSIPAVYAVRDGQVVDGFIGALPEEPIRQWLERLLPSPAENLVAEASSLRDGNPDAAEAKLRDAIRLDPILVAAKLALGRLLLNQQRRDECRALIDELASRGFLEPEAETLRAELELADSGQEAGDVDACRASAAESPHDLGLQIKLAEALASQGEYEEALQICLSVVQTDKANFGEPARKLMVDVFRVLPDDSELTGSYRRKLSAALY